MKRKFLIYNNFEFRKGTQHEDFGLIPLIIIKADKVVSIPFYGYNYVQTEQSITRNDEYNKTIKKVKDSLIHYDNMIEYIKHEDISKTTQKNVKTYYTNAILLKLKELKKQDKKEIIKEIKKRKMQKNIQVHNIKQLAKRIIIDTNINLYLKLKK